MSRVLFVPSAAEDHISVTCTDTRVPSVLGWMRGVMGVF